VVRVQVRRQPPAAEGAAARPDAQRDGRGEPHRAEAPVRGDARDRGGHHGAEGRA